MKIETARFGTMEIEEEKIITFKEGIPGFPEEKEFIIVLNDDETPISFLQSISTAELSFVIIDPFKVYTDYDFLIPDTVQETLEIQEVEDVMVFSMVTIPEDIKKMTSNLMAPIIINIKSKLGKQIILENAEYTTKHYILEQEQGGK